MFWGASKFKANLFNDTSQVTNMMHMFHDVEYFNQPVVSSWDVSSVTSFNKMFMNTKKRFNQDLSAWDTSKARDMAGMFHAAGKFNSPLFTATGSVTDFTEMFRDTCHYCSAIVWRNGNGCQFNYNKDGDKKFSGC